MQQITVEEIRVIKSKPDADKKWELVALVADGTEFTTFDLAIKEVGIGGVVEFEPAFKDGKINIKKGWKIISKGQAPAPVSHSNGGDSLEKSKSIERQVSAKLALEFAPGKDLSETLANAETIYQWISKLGDNPDPSPKPVESTKKDTKGNTVPPLQNLGELFARAAKFGLSPQDVRAAVEVNTDDEIIDFDEAWKATAKKFAADIKAQQKEGKE